MINIVFWADADYVAGFILPYIRCSIYTTFYWCKISVWYAHGYWTIRTKKGRFRTLSAKSTKTAMQNRTNRTIQQFKALFLRLNKTHQLEQSLTALPQSKAMEYLLTWLTARCETLLPAVWLGNFAHNTSQYKAYVAQHSWGKSIVMRHNAEAFT